MGEIIKVDFRNKTIEDWPDSQDKISPASSLNLDADQLIDRLKEKMKEAGAETSNFVSLEKANKIKNLMVSPTTLTDRREFVRGYTDQELEKIIDESNEHEWVARASFYRAVIDELESRGCHFI